MSLLCLAVAFAVAFSAPTEPAYAPSAFPAGERAADRARFAAALAQARSRAGWLDERLAAALASAPDGSLAKFRTDKRKFLRMRALDFAERSLKRDDATGFGYAERALEDARALDGLLDEEIALLAKAPSAANRPAVLNVRDYGAKGDGVADDAPAFVRAGAAVRALGGRPSVLRIPAGTYRMASVQRSGAFVDSLGEFCCDWSILDSQCLFANLENCRIEGDGPDKTFIRGAVYDASQLALVNCRNVTLAGLEVALEQTPFLEGRVESFDAASGACELTLKPGALAPDHPGWKKQTESFGYLFDADGLMLREGRLLPWNRPRPSENLGGGRWRIFFDRQENPQAYERHVCKIRPGLTIVLPNRHNLYGAVALRFCSFCTVEDVWVRNSRASAFGTCRSRASTFHRCRDVPRTGFTLSSDADGCFCSPGTFVVGCTFDTMGDDGLNSLGYAVTVERTGETPHETVALCRGINRGGDLAAFFDPQTAQCLGNRTVAQTDALVRMTNGWRRVTRFRRALPEGAVGSFLCVPDRSGVGTVVSGCTFRNGRLAGNVVQTSSSLFESNVYFNVSEGVRIGALGDYKEGPPPYNVLVRGCRFERTEVGLTAWIRICDETKTKWYKVACAPIRGIDVRDNVFADIAGTAVSFRHAGDCRFDGNAFERTANRWHFETCENMGPAD